MRNSTRERGVFSQWGCSQLDLGIKGDDELLADEIRGFHWMVAYGTYLREVGYAVRKAGLDWLPVA